MITTENAMTTNISEFSDGGGGRLKKIHYQVNANIPQQSVYT